VGYHVVTAAAAFHPAGFFVWPALGVLAHLRAFGVADSFAPLCVCRFFSEAVFVGW
jgi:hypothetical protein